MSMPGNCRIRNWNVSELSGRVESLPVAADLEMELRTRVLTAIADRTSLRIVGSGSKAFYGRVTQGVPLEASAHRGIIRYEPTELVVTARAGTPLDELESVLAEQGQMLAFEPPHYAKLATLGGTIACGFSGPRRPYAGAARDSVLGCRLINGKGEVLRFGGEVMKNVAGFDVSRLMVGALGTLGVLLDVSLKVLPRPRCEQALSFEYSPEAALEKMVAWSGRSLPISALAYDGRLRVRLSGSDTAVQAARLKLGGESTVGPSDYWTALREHRLPFFDGTGDLWRFSLPPGVPDPQISGEWLHDWGAAQRWLRTATAPAAIFSAATRAGGHATLFRTERSVGERFQPLSPEVFTVHRELKRAFDPHRLFNIGRMYEGL
jgi:glycolate oxidase FAD binding subunit